jgi:hypothetical protein
VDALQKTTRLGKLKSKCKGKRKEEEEQTINNLYRIATTQNNHTSITKMNDNMNIDSTVEESVDTALI